MLLDPGAKLENCDQLNSKQTNTLSILLSHFDTED
jgi:hypothetical protein